MHRQCPFKEESEFSALSCEECQHMALTRLWFLRASASALALLLSSTASCSSFCSTFYGIQKRQAALRKKKKEEEGWYQEGEEGRRG